MGVPALVDPAGQPLRAQTGFQSSGDTAYTAASRTHPDLTLFRPRRVSAVSALPQPDREMLTARVHDLARNDGWASAGLARLVDNTIGAGWDLQVSLPAERLGLSEEKAVEIAKQVEDQFDDYSSDPDCWCDAGMRTGFGGLLALAYRHRVSDGEALGVISLLDRGGPWATALEIVDPERLEQPSWYPETAGFRQGIELGPNGEPVAYHVRTFHPDDAISGAWVADPRREYLRIPRFVNGRRTVVHAFEAERAGQLRGVPALVSVVKKLRMLGRYDEAELQAAVINAVMAAFVTSPYDHKALSDSLSTGAGDEGLAQYVAGRQTYWDKAPPVAIQGAQVNFLYPGENIELTNPTHPNQVFEHFTRASLRNVASAMGLTYEQLSADWGQVNYSSARAALLEVWRGFTARAAHFASQFVQPVYVRWFEEAVVRGRIVLPGGPESFWANRSAWTRARWRMPGRGWVDPLKEAEASVMRVQCGVSTLEREAGEQGMDWDDNMAQRARELARAMTLEKAHGLQPGSLTNLPQIKTPNATDKPADGGAGAAA